MVLIHVALPVVVAGVPKRAAVFAAPRELRLQRRGFQLPSGVLAGILEANVARDGNQLVA